MKTFDSEVQAPERQAEITASPFDVSEGQEVKVWTTNVSSTIPRDHPLYTGSGRYVFCFPTLADAWEFRARTASCATREKGDPVERSLENALAFARSMHVKALVLRYGNGRVIDQWPL